MMWPWGHLAVAYLLYSAYARRRHDRPPRALPAVAVAVGSQFPDLIDKPLGWSLGVLPGGRTLAHSVFFAALLLPAAYVVAVRFDRTDAGTAFVVGHLSHLVCDVVPSALTGDGSALPFLLWPVVEPPEYEAVGGLLEGVLRYSMGPSEWLQLGLFAVVLLVWYRDGVPGVRYVRFVLDRARPAGR